MLAILFRLYFSLNIFQQAYYGFDMYFKWIRRNWVKINSFLPGLILTCLWCKWYVIIGVILIELGLFTFYFKQEKKHLVITKRVIRIAVFYLAITFLLMLIMPIFIIYIFFDLWFILAIFMLRPIEKVISNYYLRKASKKANNHPALKIAITGSFGKTSVKKFCASLLKSKYIVKDTPKSYNTPLGIAKYLNQDNLLMANFLLYEFGARHRNDIKALCRLYKYDIAIVTEVGLMHLNTFETLENILKTKMDLVENLNPNGLAILNYENELIRNYPVHVSKLTYGFNYGMYQAKNVVLNYNSSSFDLYVFGYYRAHLEVNVVGRHNVLNLLPAIILADLFGVKTQEINRIVGVDNRLMYQRISDFHLLMDAYNSNLLGAENALEIVKKHKGQRYIITPGFVECDSANEYLIKAYAFYINQSIDRAFLIKNNFTSKLALQLSIEFKFFDNFKEAYVYFLNHHLQNALVLVENDWLDVY